MEINESVAAPRPAAGLLALRGRHLLSVLDLSPDELAALLTLAQAGKRNPKIFGQPLAGKGVGLVFFNPSLRTRASMIMAVSRLGGQPVPLEIGAGTWDLEHADGVVMDGSKAEHVREAVPVLAQYVDAIGVRCFPRLRSLAEDRADPVLQAFARHAPVPVINLESAMEHPCQALADLLTIKERLGGLRRKKLLLTWANHPKPLPHAVPNSLARAALLAGADLTLAAPPEYLPAAPERAVLAGLAAASGATLAFTSQRETAYEGAEVVYAKSWASPLHYGAPAADIACRQAYRDWCVTSAAMDRTDRGIFMHCLPVRRNVVVADAVLDSPRSVVVEQAANRLHVQTALLASLIGG